MLNYIEYLNLPTRIAVTIVGLFLVIQIVGELLEFKGKVVPEAVKVRKYFARKNRERETLSKMTDLMDEYNQMAKTLVEVNRVLSEIDKHYSKDNISMRDEWI